MVKKVRIKFIFIVMLTIFFAFGVIFCASVILQKKECVKDVKDSLSVIEREYKDFNHTGEKSFVVKIQTNFTIPTYSIENFDENAFTKHQIEDIVKKALSNDKEFEKVDGVYYKQVKDNNIILMFGTDGENYLKNCNDNITKTAVVLAVVYVLLFLIIIALSFKIIKPIKETLNTQRQFISNASHELKTPISIISANAEVLKNIDNNEWVKSIKTQTERMNVLVSDMLTLAKADEDRLPQIREQFNLSMVLTSFALSFDALCFEQGKQLILDIQKDVDYVGDADCIKKLINILLDNAVKYSSKNGTIKLTLKKEVRPVITVYNTGSEIESDSADKIFERFYRGDNSRARETGGNGLGLSIAQSICLSNKWKISAKSKYKEYMCITVVL